MGHQAISRWTCDVCSAGDVTAMSDNGSSYFRILPEGWQFMHGRILCSSCVTALDAAIKVALTPRRKETPDAQS